MIQVSKQHFEVVIVGAGFGGMGAAIQLKKMGYDNILILDREDDLGGTWYVNHYPGLAVDIPSPTYSYWFEPNPRWSRLYAPGSELKQYADHVADKYDVRRHMRFNTPVDGARWDEDGQSWQVALSTARPDVPIPDHRDRLPVTAAQPRHPGHRRLRRADHPQHGLGRHLRSGGRRIGLIGTGATAVQLIPELARTAADLTVYQRTPIHVVPKLDFAIPRWCADCSAVSRCCSERSVSPPTSISK